MDEPKMSHALEANDFSGSELREIETAAESKPARRGRFAWESYIRCLLIIAIAGLVGFMAWRPGVLRFSLLMSMVSPSRGDSLAWKPEEETVLPRAQRKFTPTPPEWRLTSGHSRAWEAQSAGASLLPYWQGGKLPSAPWSRSSINPWSWQDDATTRPRRHADTDDTPSQKPASDFRAKDTDAWGTRQTVAAPVIAPVATPTPSPTPAAPATRTPASLAVPELTPLPTMPAPESHTTLELPPLDLDAVGPAPASGPSRPTETTTLSLPPLSMPDLPGQFADPVFPEEMPEPTVVQARPEPQPEAEVEAPVSTDWKNREITDRIPGAYLTVYPKLKFIGLCLPGQGYIRKYNQVAVPRDTTSQPKTSAADGLTPYGKYYVAGRSRGPEGARLVLSWPSPDDARRIGLPPDQVTAVEMAWLDRSAVPQDTAAGGGVALTGLRRWLESTDGGFALEEPHMEEIFTALPDGAWVFIQQ